MLGHLFLDLGYIIDSNKWKCAEEYSVYLENEYDLCMDKSCYNSVLFACGILMPKNRFLSIAESTKKNNYFYLPLICEHFNVSRDMVLFWGRKLGIFPYFYGTNINN